MTAYKWSKTAATNATADSTINFAEGQAPSSLNDSCRAVMAAVAKLRDDTNGTLVPGGTANALTITSNQVFDTLANMNGARLAFLPQSPNTGAVTINVDGLGVKALQATQGVDLPAGTLQTSLPTTATYSNSLSAWLLHVGAASQVPLGVIMPYAGSSAPSTFLMCNGAAVSRTTYATLFGLLSTTYGTGDGSTTFNVPDLRGRVPAGNDTMGASAASRLTATYFGASGSTTGNTGGGESVTLLTANLASHTHTGTTGNQSNDHSHTYSGTSSGVSVGHTHSGTTGNDSPNHTHTGTTDSANNDHTHSGTTSVESADHTHTYSGTTGTESADHTHESTLPNLASAFSSGGNSARTNTTTTATTTGASASHTHSYSGTSAGISANHTHTVTTGGMSASHQHAFTSAGVSVNHQHSFTSGGDSVDHTHTYSGTSSGVNLNHTHSFTTAATGSATPTAVVQPTIILNYIIRAL